MSPECGANLLIRVCTLFQVFVWYVKNRHVSDCCLFVPVSPYLVTSLNLWTKRLRLQSLDVKRSLAGCLVIYSTYNEGSTVKPRLSSGQDNTVQAGKRRQHCPTQ